MTSLAERTALLGAVGVALAALKNFGPFLWPYRLDPTWSPVVQSWFLLVDLLWVAAMLVTYRRDPSGPMWKLFLVYQAVATFGVIWVVPTSLTWTLSQLSIGIGSVVFVHLVLAFPSGRLTDRYDRLLVLGAYILILVTRLAWLVVWSPGPSVDKVGFSPRNPYVIWPDEDLAWAFGPGAIVLIAAFLYVAVLVGLWRHWQRASPALRRALLPITVAAPLQLAIIVAWHLADANSSGLGGLRTALQHPVVGLAGVVFPVGFLAVLVYDPAIEREDPGRLEAVGSVARLALENERLAAQVRAQLEEVRASRSRIVEAADAERRKIERDLHDGAQQRLVALAMRLDQAREGSAGASALIDATTAELLTAIREVRDLAHGLHPTILTESGLAAAVEALAERTPFPVTTEVTDARFATDVEVAAYYVIAEGLTNIARYADATEARVEVAAVDGRLLVTVTDNGRGGADPAKGSGLRGLADRLAAIDGELDLASPSGAGTTLTASLPARG